MTATNRKPFSPEAQNVAYQSGIRQLAPLVDRIAEGASPIPRKKPPLRIAWTACQPRDAKLSANRKPSLFCTEAKAREENDLFKSYHGYAEAVVFCELCCGWHLQHIFAADLITGAATNAGPQVP